MTAVKEILEKSSVDVTPHYHHQEVAGVNVFYCEAGAANAPVVVLLHGFPTSSQMFRNLIPALAQDFRVIAPDYPGFGLSGAPDRSKFAYTFNNIANLVDGLLANLGVTRFAMYVFDYGAPVGWRLALKHPERVSALIIQNGNAYAEGLAKFWDPIKAYWVEQTDERRHALDFLVTSDATKWQYTNGVSDVSRISPATWLYDQIFLDRPGNADIQLDLFLDYGTNLALYPSVQAFFRKRQPPALLVWGVNDEIFPAEGAHPYKRDLTDLEFHLFKTGHFALEDKGDEIIPLIQDFLKRKLLACG